MSIKHEVSSTTKVYTPEDVAKHSTENDCWVIFRDMVLDLTPWIERHPGGKLPILRLAGIDATDEIVAIHGDRVVDMMIPKFVIGKVSGQIIPPHVQEFRELMQEIVHDPKWMDTDVNYYIKKIPIILSFFILSAILYLGFESVLIHCLAGVFLGLFWQQCLLIGHDAGHAGITHNTDKDLMIGWLVGTFLNGFSIAWWKKNHNAHHIATNSIEHDPDIQHLPFIAISEKFLNNVYSTYYERCLKFDKLSSFLITIQHITFFPTFALARVFVHVQGILCLLNFNENIPKRWIELFGFFLYFVWYFSFVFIIGGYFGRTGLSQGLFMLVSHLTVGIIHLQISLNHFASPTHSDGDELGPRGGKDFLSAQLYGTCDIYSPTYLDWFHGGLQFQVEHHLCPRMPRHNLRKFIPYIQKLAKKHDLPHITRTFFDAVSQVQDTLGKVAVTAEKMKKTVKISQFFTAELSWILFFCLSVFLKKKSSTKSDEK
eukprot:c19472_g1_i2.p1 GENE.c19472_g1_i2~~c19472_g1_i2.p1  ORF type:complete len:486 (-),score=96.52 c19472_g1_i2:142-1599(-)